MERHLGPIGRIEDVAGGARELGRFFGGVPELLNRGARIADQLDDATRDGLVLAPDTVAAIGQAEARQNRWLTVGVWAIVAMLVVLAFIIF
jgi:ubiquinone biosynthesis protein